MPYSPRSCCNSSAEISASEVALTFTVNIFGLRIIPGHYLQALPRPDKASNGGAVYINRINVLLVIWLVVYSAAQSIIVYHIPITVRINASAGSVIVIVSSFKPSLSILI